MQNLWNDITNILTAPFIGDLDVMQLFLLVGLVIVFAALWSFVLFHIRIAAETVI
jgi:hypothetical protein